MCNVIAHPSLALIKYWGKQQKNTAATSSLAINLKACETTTKVSLADEDSVHINGKEAALFRYEPFFANLREVLNTDAHFSIISENNFPTAAGLASSSSGFASMAYGCAKLINKETSLETISACARLGSASAARPIFGGFTILKRGEESASPLLSSAHWPELKVIIAIVNTEAKKISSREAMLACEKTSPFYRTWIDSAEALFLEAIEAVNRRDLDKLGPLMRSSYLQMFSTMFTAKPPIIYWEKESLALIKTCEKLREANMSIWETMDAGPQVKMLCEEGELEEILFHLTQAHPDITFFTSDVGDAVRCLE